jgi:hypothetical protein
MVIVRDNFYNNPDEVVEFAKTLEYKLEVAGGHFYRSVGIIPTYDTSVYFENFLGIKIDFSGKEWNSHNDYSNFNGSFYYPPNFEEMGSGVDAIHHDWFEWVGILYLHDLGPQWGTQMWMHQETGKYITDVPDSGSPDPLIEENSEAFIKTDYISSRYNRLLLYPGRMFHSATFPDGASDEQLASRLCQIFNFQAIANKP